MLLGRRVIIKEEQVGSFMTGTIVLLGGGCDKFTSSNWSVRTLEAKPLLMTFRISRRCRRATVYLLRL